MKKIIYKFLILLFFMSLTQATEYREHRVNIKALSTTKSELTDVNFQNPITPDGQALHLGNTAMMSYGCIHVGREDISALFKWAKVGMLVVVMRGHYSQFLKEEINKFKEDIKEYDIISDK